MSRATIAFGGILAFTFGIAAAQTLPTTVEAQFEILGDQPNQAIGFGDKAVGDINGDGYPDLAIRLPQKDGPGMGTGRLRVLSGRTREILFEVFGQTTNGHFPYAVEPGGDFDNDDLPDLLVIDQASNQARVLSGIDGSLLKTFSVPNVAQGVECVALGDINDDDVGDYAFGWPADSTAGASAGMVRVMSGLNATVVWTKFGASAGDQMGFQLEALPDLDGDDVMDLAIASPMTSGDGLIDIFSGIDGSSIGTIDGDPGTRLGVSGLAIGDFNGDHQPDIVVGTEFAGAIAYDLNSLAQFQTFAPIPSMPGNNVLANVRIANAGDINGDGRDDVALSCLRHYVSGPGFPNAAEVIVRSGLTTNVIAITECPYPVQVPPATVAPYVFEIGDRNDDGYSEFGIGENWADFGFPNAGRIRIVGSCGGKATYGTGCAGSAGVIPTFVSFGCPAAGSDINLQLTVGPTSVSTIIVLGAAKGTIYATDTCNLLIQPPVVAVSFGVFATTMTLPATIPAPVFGGLVHLQAFVLETGPNPVAASAGVSIDVL